MFDAVKSNSMSQRGSASQSGNPSQRGSASQSDNPSQRGSASQSDSPLQRNNGSHDVCPICGGPSDDCPRESRIYYVQNLDCAHCAAEMEEKLARLPRMERADITYATKQLRVTCPHPDQMRETFQQVCRTIDDDVRVLQQEDSKKSACVETPGEHVCDGEDPALVKAEAQTESATAAGLRDMDPEESGKAERKRDIVSIVASALLFVIGEIVSFVLPDNAYLASALFLVAYVVAGGKVLLHAARNLRHGRVFDENFLMSIATFGAIGVQQFPEAVGVMLFYRVGELFEDMAVDRSRSQIMEAVDMRPETVNRLVSYKEAARNREVRTIPAQDAVLGDYLLIKPGERIPLDGTIVEGESRLDTSPVTGEPVPVSVGRGSKAISGCMNESGLLILHVDKPLSESMVTRILDSVENASANKPQIQRFITRFAKIYTPVVIAIALATAVIPSFVTGNWQQWVYTACTFLVISCPCAIVLSVPLSFFAGIGAGSKLGVLFKGGNAIEALKCVRAVVMDKTGTITQGTFQVRRIVAVPGVSKDDVLEAAAAAESASTHPIAASIVAAAVARKLPKGMAADVRETAGRGVSARVSTSQSESNEVLCGNESFLNESGVSNLAAAGDGQDSFIGTCVHVAQNGTYIGSIFIADEPKPDSAQAVSIMNKDGLHTVMLTGDARDAAEKVGARMGIEDVRARLLPDQKVDALVSVREKYGPVMFVGDGINDAPVLAGADVGAAMGSGSDAAIEAADVVFMHSSLLAVPQSLRIAKTVSAIATQNIVFALGVKATVMVLGFMGVASMWAAVFADVGVAMLCILNSIRILYKKYV